jgi:hypothetical protein
MADETQAPAPELTAEIKELLKRHVLKRAAVDKKGNVHFDEKHIEKLDAKTLTFIEA